MTGVPASDEEIRAASVAFLDAPLLDAAKAQAGGDAAACDLPPAHFQSLNEAVGWLSHFAEMDCDCDLSDDEIGGQKRRSLTDPDNNCSTCAARQAIERILRVTEPRLETMHPERTVGPVPERIYLETWREENKRRSGVNGGYTVLEGILNPKLSQPAPPVTPHDSRVATTLIQWLGTNCGRSFIERCERRIIEDRAATRQLDIYAAQATDRQAHHAEIIEQAKAIAEQWIADNHFFARSELTRQIIGLVMRYYNGRKEPEPQTTAGQRYFDLRNE